MNGPTGPGVITVADLRDEKQRWCIAYAGSRAYIGRCSEKSDGTMIVRKALDYSMQHGLDQAAGQIRTILLVIPCEMLGPIDVVIQPTSLIPLRDGDEAQLEQLAAKINMAMSPRLTRTPDAPRILVPR
jgi:hypothetical protein